MAANVRRLPTLPLSGGSVATGGTAGVAAGAPVRPGSSGGGSGLTTGAGGVPSHASPLMPLGNPSGGGGVAMLPRSRGDTGVGGVGGGNPTVTRTVGLSGSFGMPPPSSSPAAGQPESGGGGGGKHVLGLTVTSLSTASHAPSASSARASNPAVAAALAAAARRRKLRLARIIRVALYRAASVSAFCDIMPPSRHLTTAQVLFMLYPSLLPPWAAARRDAVTTLASIPASGHLCLRLLMASVRSGLGLPDWVMLATSGNPNPFRDTLAISAQPPRDADAVRAAASVNPALALMAASQAGAAMVGAVVPGTGMPGGSGGGPKHTCWRWHLDYADRDAGTWKCMLTDKDVYWAIRGVLMRNKRREGSGTPPATVGKVTPTSCPSPAKTDAGSDGNGAAPSAGAPAATGSSPPPPSASPALVRHGSGGGSPIVPALRISEAAAARSAAHAAAVAMGSVLRDADTAHLDLRLRVCVGPKCVWAEPLGMEGGTGSAASGSRTATSTFLSAAVPVAVSALSAPLESARVLDAPGGGRGSAAGGVTRVCLTPQSQGGGSTSTSTPLTAPSSGHTTPSPSASDAAPGMRRASSAPMGGGEGGGDEVLLLPAMKLLTKGAGNVPKDGPHYGDPAMAAAVVAKRRQLAAQRAAERAAAVAATKARAVELQKAREADTKRAMAAARERARRVEQEKEAAAAAELARSKARQERAAQKSDEKALAQAVAAAAARTASYARRVDGDGAVMAGGDDGGGALSMGEGGIEVSGSKAGPHEPGTALSLAATSRTGRYMSPSPVGSGSVTVRSDGSVDAMQHAGAALEGSGLEGAASLPTGTPGMQPSGARRSSQGGGIAMMPAAVGMGDSGKRTMRGGMDDGMAGLSVGGTATGSFVDSGGGGTAPHPRRHSVSGGGSGGGTSRPSPTQTHIPIINLTPTPTKSHGAEASSSPSPVLTSRPAGMTPSPTPLPLDAAAAASGHSGLRVTSRRIASSSGSGSDRGDHSGRDTGARRTPQAPSPSAPSPTPSAPGSGRGAGGSPSPLPGESGGASGSISSRSRHSDGGDGPAVRDGLTRSASTDRLRGGGGGSPQDRTLYQQLLTSKEALEAVKSNFTGAKGVTLGMLGVGGEVDGAAFVPATPSAVGGGESGRASTAMHSHRSLHGGASARSVYSSRSNASGGGGGGGGLDASAIQTSSQLANLPHNRVPTMIATPPMLRSLPSTHVVTVGTSQASGRSAMGVLMSPTGHVHLHGASGGGFGDGSMLYPTPPSTARSNSDLPSSRTSSTARSALSGTSGASSARTARSALSESAVIQGTPPLHPSRVTSPHDAPTAPLWPAATAFPAPLASGGGARDSRTPSPAGSLASSRSATSVVTATAVSVSGGGGGGEVDWSSGAVAVVAGAVEGDEAVVPDSVRIGTAVDDGVPGARMEPLEVEEVEDDVAAGGVMAVGAMMGHAPSRPISPIQEEEARLSDTSSNHTPRSIATAVSHGGEGGGGGEWTPHEPSPRFEPGEVPPHQPVTLPPAPPSSRGGGGKEESGLLAHGAPPPPPKTVRSASGGGKVDSPSSTARIPSPPTRHSEDGKDGHTASTSSLPLRHATPPGGPTMPWGGGEAGVDDGHAAVEVRPLSRPQSRHAHPAALSPAAASPRQSRATSPPRIASPSSAFARLAPPSPSALVATHLEHVPATAVNPMQPQAADVPTQPKGVATAQPASQMAGPLYGEAEDMSASPTASKPRAGTAGATLTRSPSSLSRGRTPGVATRGNGAHPVDALHVGVMVPTTPPVTVVPPQPLTPGAAVPTTPNMSRLVGSATRPAGVFSSQLSPKGGAGGGGGAGSFSGAAPPMLDVVAVVARPQQQHDGGRGGGEGSGGGNESKQHKPMGGDVAGVQREGVSPPPRAAPCTPPTLIVQPSRATGAALPSPAAANPMLFLQPPGGATPTCLTPTPTNAPEPGGPRPLSMAAAGLKGAMPVVPARVTAPTIPASALVTRPVASASLVTPLPSAVSVVPTLSPRVNAMTVAGGRGMPPNAVRNATTGAFQTAVAHALAGGTPASAPDRNGATSPPPPPPPATVITARVNTVAIPSPLPPAGGDASGEGSTSRRHTAQPSSLAGGTSAPAPAATARHRTGGGEGAMPRVKSMTRVQIAQALYEAYAPEAVDVRGGDGMAGQAGATTSRQDSVSDAEMEELHRALTSGRRGSKGPASTHRSGQSEVEEKAGPSGGTGATDGAPPHTAASTLTIGAVVSDLITTVTHGRRSSVGGQPLAWPGGAATLPAPRPVTSDGTPATARSARAAAAAAVATRPVPPASSPSPPPPTDVSVMTMTTTVRHTTHVSAVGRTQWSPADRGDYAMTHRSRDVGRGRAGGGGWLDGLDDAGSAVEGWLDNDDGTADMLTSLKTVYLHNHSYHDRGSEGHGSTSPFLPPATRAAFGHMAGSDGSISPVPASGSMALHGLGGHRVGGGPRHSRAGFVSGDGSPPPHAPVAAPSRSGTLVTLRHRPRLAELARTNTLGQGDATALPSPMVSPAPSPPSSSAHPAPLFSPTATRHAAMAMAADQAVEALFAHATSHAGVEGGGDPSGSPPPPAASPSPINQPHRPAGHRPHPPAHGTGGGVASWTRAVGARSAMAGVSHTMHQHQVTSHGGDHSPPPEAASPVRVARLSVGAGGGGGMVASPSAPALLSPTAVATITAVAGYATAHSRGRQMLHDAALPSNGKPGAGGLHVAAPGGGEGGGAPPLRIAFMEPPPPTISPAMPPAGEGGGAAAHVVIATAAAGLRALSPSTGQGGAPQPPHTWATSASGAATGVGGMGNGGSASAPIKMGAPAGGATVASMLSAMAPGGPVPTSPLARLGGGSGATAWSRGPHHHHGHGHGSDASDVHSQHVATSLAVAVNSSGGKGWNLKKLNAAHGGGAAAGGSGSGADMPKTVPV